MKNARRSTLPFNRKSFTCLRLKRGRTQSNLAKETGISKSVIMRWENGSTKNPSGRLLGLAAKCLDVPVDAFQLNPKAALQVMNGIKDIGLQGIFPAMVTRDYDECLLGECVAYSILMHMKSHASITPCTIFRHKQGHLAFKTRHRAGGKSWNGAGVVVVVPPCAFLVGSYHGARRDLFSMVLSVGGEKSYRPDVMHGVLLAMTANGNPSSTRVMVKAVKETAENNGTVDTDKYEPGNMLVEQLPDDVRRYLVSLGKRQVIAGLVP